MSNDNIHKRYFIFSKTQMENMIKLQKQRGGLTPKFGEVIVNGSPKIYTDIVASPDNIRYSDSKILLAEDIRMVKYTKPNIR